VGAEKLDGRERPRKHSLVAEARGRIDDGEEAPSRFDETPSPGAKHRFIAALGHGGMADVYLAVAVGPAGFNKLLVIKRLRQSLTDEPELRAMFLDEARLAARLNHRNVVQTNEVGVVDEQYFIAMEYLDGQPLNRVFARARQDKSEVPLGIALHILCDVLAGLQYAHDLEDYDGSPLHVVHRDISPQNVFVTYDGQTKIVDFGIARAARRMVETQVGVLKGKISYMAPEQAFSPSCDIDGRADVFSVGVMLWEAIAGKRLWHGLGDPEILVHLLKEMPRVRDVVPDVLPELAAISERALARDPDERYASASALRAELEPCIEKLGFKVTAEEVGAYVRDLFAEQRAELRGIIDRQLAALEDAPETKRELSLRGAPLPEIRGSIPPPDVGSFPPSSYSPGSGYPPASSRRSPCSSMPIPMPPPNPPAPSERPRNTLLGAVLGSEPELPALAMHSRTPFFVALGAAVLVVGAVGWLLSSQTSAAAKPAASAARDAPAQSSSATSRTSASSLPALAPSGSYLHAKVTASPPDTRILVDGAALPSNPFEGKFLKDGAVHRLQFEAVGFFPQSRLAVFDKDLRVDIALQLKPKTTGDGAQIPAAGDVIKPDPYELSPR
jgi:eukaryotic-like serine/threonine-protein kinase